MVAVSAICADTDERARWLSDKVSPASTLQNDGVANRQLFIAGKVASYLTGQYDIAPIKKAAPDVELGALMTPHPEGKKTAGILNGWSYVVPKDAANPADAKKFLQFINTADNMGFFTDTFPARISSLKLPRFQTRC